MQVLGGAPPWLPNSMNTFISTITCTCSKSMCTCSSQLCWKFFLIEKSSNSWKMCWDVTRGLPDIRNHAWYNLMHHLWIKLIWILLALYAAHLLYYIPPQICLQYGKSAWEWKAGWDLGMRLITAIAFSSAAYWSEHPSHELGWLVAKLAFLTVNHLTQRWNVDKHILWILLIGRGRWLLVWGRGKLHGCYVIR